MSICSKDNLDGENEASELPEGIARDDIAARWGTEAGAREGTGNSESPEKPLEIER